MRTVSRLEPWRIQCSNECTEASPCTAPSIYLGINAVKILVGACLIFCGAANYLHTNRNHQPLEVRIKIPIERPSQFIDV